MRCLLVVAVAEAGDGHVGVAGGLEGGEPTGYVGHGAAQGRHRPVIEGMQGTAGFGLICLDESDRSSGPARVEHVGDDQPRIIASKGVADSSSAAIAVRRCP